jgi:GxxExxY protein
MLLRAKPEGAEGAERTENFLTDQIIGAAIEVHRHLGPGLLESAYEECFCYELTRRGITFQRQLAIPLVYKGLKLDCGYKLDVVVEDSVIVELKAIEDLLPIHSSQLLTYLKTQDKRVGLLINFNVPILKNGLKRIVNRYAGPHPGANTSASSAPSDLKPPQNEEFTDRGEDPITQKHSASSSAPPRLRVEKTPSTTNDTPCYSAS